MIKGRAQIGKVVPRVKETEHIMSRPSKLPLLSQFELLGIERYSRFDDSDTADFPSTAAAESDAESPGDRLTPDALRSRDLYLREPPSNPGSASPEPPICRSPSSQTSSPNSQQQDDSVGDCRSAHGMVRVESTRSTTAGTTASAVDWREHLRSVRDDALEVLANW